jgi:hypothetical protein
MKLCLKLCGAQPKFNLTINWTLYLQGLKREKNYIYFLKNMKVKRKCIENAQRGSAKIGEICRVFYSPKSTPIASQGTEYFGCVSASVFDPLRRDWSWFPGIVLSENLLKFSISYFRNLNDGLAPVGKITN